MQVPLQIAFHNLERSDVLAELIEEKAAWLERFCGRITSCRVLVGAPHRRRRHGNPYQVRIDLTVPGGEFVVNLEAAPCGRGPILDAAIRDAFEAARRCLEDHARRQRKGMKGHRQAPSVGGPGLH